MRCQICTQTISIWQDLSGKWHAKCGCIEVTGDWFESVIESHKREVRGFINEGYINPATMGLGNP